MTGEELRRKHVELNEERDAGNCVLMSLRSLTTQNHARWAPVEEAFDAAWKDIFAQQRAIEARLEALHE